MRYSDHPVFDTTEPATEPDATVVSWPEPSPLQSWWNDIMQGVKPPRTRTGGQKSSHLPQN
ncbi:hypothetical protein AB0I35_14280 [Nocardia sp. NPDC050378]|uniref:hypothetical protein n=1 Tax=Nocardia sp. NPDC050378 TaxID=3155400 RepID=UPI003408A62D